MRTRFKAVLVISAILALRSTRAVDRSGPQVARTPARRPEWTSEAAPPRYPGPRRTRPHGIIRLVKLAYAAFVCLLVPVYWREYGPENFLWFSDIALFVTLAALWARSALLASMAAVGVLALELLWTLDFLTGGRLVGLAGYMFEPDKPLYLRGLSLFHLLLPPLLLWLLHRLGYDRRALVAQTTLAWMVLPLTYLTTDPEQNINWVFGPGTDLPAPLSPSLYLGLLMVALPTFVYLPSHWALQKLFARP
ncbi:hypothetical protein [Virgifigura deserti]|uniref:hypothetical protein n=1 Tax=Virgifigura deserti TaxID=2268457 RepID=UPI003CCC2D82